MSAQKVRLNALQPGAVMARIDYLLPTGEQYAVETPTLAVGMTRKQAERRIAKGDTVTVEAVRVVEHFDHGIRGHLLAVTIDGQDYEASSNAYAWLPEV